MSRSVQNPKTLTPLINMITPRIQPTRRWLGIATLGYFAAAFLTGGLIYLGNSNHRLSDTNDALSADMQLLIEAYTYGEKDFCLLAPQPDDFIIWEEMPYRTGPSGR